MRCAQGDREDKPEEEYSSAETRVKSESEESRKTGKGDSGSRKGMSEKSLHVFVEISSKK